MVLMMRQTSRGLFYNFSSSCSFKYFYYLILYYVFTIIYIYFHSLLDIQHHNRLLLPFSQHKCISNKHLEYNKSKKHNLLIENQRMASFYMKIETFMKECNNMIKDNRISCNNVTINVNINFDYW